MKQIIVLLSLVLAFFSIPKSTWASTQYGDHSYKIEVKTGDVENAGTDAYVYIKLIGDKAEGHKIFLDSPDVDDFEKGSDNYFEIKDIDVGNIVAVTIGHDDSGKDAGWFLDFVAVRDMVTNKKYLFYHQNWISRDNRIELEYTLLEDSLKNDPTFQPDPSSGKPEFDHYEYEVIDNLGGSQPHKETRGYVIDITREKLQITDGITDTIIKVAGSGGVNFGIWSVSASAGYDRREYLRELEKTYSKEHITKTRNTPYLVPPGEVYIAQYEVLSKINKGNIKWGQYNFRLGLVEDVDFNLTIVSLKKDRMLFPNTINEPFKKEIKKRWPASHEDSSGASREMKISAGQLSAIREIEIPEAQAQRGGAQPQRDSSQRGGGQPQPSQPRSGDLKSYKVVVETGTLEGAGTDANVEIKLIGNKGETAMHLINNPGYNDFKNASIDTFNFEDKDAGVLSAIVVKHDNARNNPKWYLVKVTAYPPDGKRYVFTYNNWIPDAAGKPEARIQEDSLRSATGGSVIVPKPQQPSKPQGGYLIPQGRSGTGTQRQTPAKPIPAKPQNSQGASQGSTSSQSQQTTNTTGSQNIDWSKISNVLGNQSQRE